MNIISRCTLLVSFFFFVGANLSADAATLYSVVPVAGANSNAFAINASGDVTGVFHTSGGADHAFIYTQANGFLDLGTLSGGNSVGRDINNSDQVVGQSDLRAFRYTSGGGMVALPGATSSDAKGINNGNSVIGSSYDSSATTIVWSPTNVPTALFPTDSTEGYAISPAGSRVGRVDGVTGYYSDGSSNTFFSDLGLFLPNDINTSEQIAGSKEGVAAIYDPSTNTSTPLGLLNPTDDFSDTFGINSFNQVVGVSDGTGGFTWTQADGMQNLSTLLQPAYSGWSVLSANDVNDNGWISGQGVFNGEQRAIILIPQEESAVPEPSTLALAGLGAGAGLILALRNARSRRQRTRAKERTT